MRTNKIWTEKEIELLKELYPDRSLSKKEIAKRFNRTWKAVACKAHNIELPLRSYINYWSSEDIEKLKELNKNSHLVSRDIGKILNRTPNTVRSKLSELGIKRPKLKKKEFTLNNIEEHLYD